MEVTGIKVFDGHGGNPVGFDWLQFGKKVFPTQLP
jgi:hypothetical protein